MKSLIVEYIRVLYSRHIQPVRGITYHYHNIYILWERKIKYINSIPNYNVWVFFRFKFVFKCYVDSITIIHVLLLVILPPSQRINNFEKSSCFCALCNMMLFQALDA